MTENEIRKEIRRLRKSIKDFPAKSKARKEIKREIKDLKGQLVEKEGIDLAKKPLIDEILMLDPECKTWGIKLYNHSIENLKIHLKKIKAGRLDKGK
jgi:hypothetical protein